MNREQTEAAVNGFFSARMKNQPSEVFETFADGAKVRMAGAQDASSIAHRTQTTEELQASIEGLVGDWKWTDLQMLSILVDGNSASARYDLSAIHLPTGTQVSTESMDQFYFNDQAKITELIEFVDTALVAQIDK